MRRHDFFGIKIEVLIENFRPVNSAFCAIMLVELCRKIVVSWDRLDALEFGVRRRHAQHLINGQTTRTAVNHHVIAPYPRNTTPDRDWLPPTGYLAAVKTVKLRKHHDAPLFATSITTSSRQSQRGSSHTVNMRFLSTTLLVAAATLMVPVQSLYFYIDGVQPKCFFERLPKDTLVVGQYSAEEFSLDRNAYLPNPNLDIFISVDEAFDNDHRIVSSRGHSTGKFTFTSADSGDHRICFTPSHSTGQSGWLGGNKLGGVKLMLDLAIGTTSEIESSDTGKITDLVQKVKDLNGRLMDIKREQLFQRVSDSRESHYVRKSKTNSIHRSVRPSSAISLSPPTPVSSAGP